jgi:hypothetical protein
MVAGFFVINGYFFSLTQRLYATAQCNCAVENNFYKIAERLAGKGYYFLRKSSIFDLRNKIAQMRRLFDKKPKPYAYK